MKLATSDPDRFLDYRTPGAQEWWYFDAISEDGRDALVLIWFAALPFDPAYGIAALRHLRDPGRVAAPRALDHCAIAVSWYRDGRTVAYALNRYRAGHFAHEPDPFAVAIAGNRLGRGPDGYALRVRTPAVDGKGRIEAHLHFRPAPGTAPFEQDLGTPGAPHLWLLAAPDCRVEGAVAVTGRARRELAFRGRGYHDHNAGAEEITRAMRRWHWGRVQVGPLTHVYYRAEPHQGQARALWITCRDGRPEAIRTRARIDEDGARRTLYGLRHGRRLRVSDAAGGLVVDLGRCVDDGPFYRRWVATYAPWGTAHPAGTRSADAAGVSEFLDTRNLHRPLFNWMIPYRLKRPEA